MQSLVPVLETAKDSVKFSGHRLDTAQVVRLSLDVIIGFIVIALFTATGSPQMFKHQSGKLAVIVLVSFRTCQIVIVSLPVLAGFPVLAGLLDLARFLVLAGFDRLSRLNFPCRCSMAGPRREWKQC